MANLTHPTGADPESDAYDISLRVAQIFLALFFVCAGFAKLVEPADPFAQVLPWGAEDGMLVPVAGAVGLLGGVGLLLPTIARVWSDLILLTALGLCVLQVLAMMFNLSHREIELATINVVLLAISIFVLWGRGIEASNAPAADFDIQAERERAGEIR